MRERSRWLLGQERAGILLPAGSLPRASLAAKLLLSVLNEAFAARGFELIRRNGAIAIHIDHLEVDDKRYGLVL